MKYNYSLLIIFLIILVKFSSAQNDIQAYLMMSDSLITEKLQETKLNNLEKLQVNSSKKKKSNSIKLNRFNEPESTACNFFNPSTDYATAYPTSTGGGNFGSRQLVAEDIVIPIDKDFTLHTINVNMWTQFTYQELTSAEIIIYKDINGLPDTNNIVLSQSNAIPVSQTFLLDNGYNNYVFDVAFDMGSVLLSGQPGSTTTYWISIYFTLEDPTNEALWEFTRDVSQGSSAAVSQDNGSTWLIPSSSVRELVYTFSGDCEQHLGIDDYAINEFNYFPNPVTNGVLELNAKDIIDTVTIYNILGQNVINHKVSATNTQVDMSALKAGTYILKVLSNEQIGTYKIVKNN